MPSADNFRKLTPEEITEVFRRFKKQNPAPATELKAQTPFTLLVSVVLSAQATDKGVNKATEPLYKIADTPEKILALGEDGLIGYIKTIGMYRSKAKHIMGLCRMLIDEFGGKLPRTREDLERLPGVGRKSASVILNVVYSEPAMPVDTHLLRVSPRIGLSSGTTPIEVEKDLLACIPSEFLMNAHHWLLLHGRYVCVARKPLCSQCLIADLCKRNGVTESR